jgi:hypothetical protein
MTRRRAAVVLTLLAVLLFAPPLAMAYHNCAGMSHMCEAPCGAMAGVVVVPATSTAPDLIMRLVLQPPPLLPAIVAPSLDPPPKSRPPAA